jgi:capsule polysaccharide export protein KpsE/RkpR
LWPERKTLLRIGIWALAISTAIAFLIPRKYESTVRIMPPEAQNGSAALLAALGGRGAPAALGSLAGNLLGMKNTGPLFVDLVRSRTIQDDLVERFQLQSVYWKRYRQDARKVLNRRTEVREDRKSGVITLSVTDRKRERARDMAQAYVEELDRLVAQVSTSSARRERIFIEQRLQTVKQDLDSASREFSEFASKNATLDIKEQTRAMVESAASLQGELIAAQSRLQSLEQIYTSNNVRVRALRAQVGELRRQLQRMGGSAGDSSSDLYPPIRQLPVLGVRWADLYRRMRIQETVFLLLSQQHEMARIEEAKEIPTVRVIDPADLPEKKSFPPRLLIVIGLTSLTLIGAGMWIVASKRRGGMDSEDLPKKDLQRLYQLLRHVPGLGRNGNSGTGE